MNNDHPLRLFEKEGEEIKHNNEMKSSNLAANTVISEHFCTEKTAKDKKKPYLHTNKGQHTKHNKYKQCSILPSIGFNAKPTSLLSFWTSILLLFNSLATNIRASAADAMFGKMRANISVRLEFSLSKVSATPIARESKVKYKKDKNKD